MKDEGVEEHAAEGGKIILKIFYNMDDAKFRQIAYEIARFHHEKYNGKGYPDGLVGAQIFLDNKDEVIKLMKQFQE